MKLMHPRDTVAYDTNVISQKHIPTKRDTVAVVGLGYVGLPLAIAIENRGYTVIGFDIDEQKLHDLRNREAPFLSNEEEQQFKKSSIRVTGNAADLSSANTFIICVPTPVTTNHEPDFGPLLGAARFVGQHMTKGALIVVESTVNPGACEDLVIPMLERESGLIVSRDFLFAHCPERINPGDERYSVRNIPRVIGASDESSLYAATQLYESVIDAEIVKMASIREAEAVKMVENTFRDINIAFVNELAMAFEKAGIDTVNVIKGASTKPFGFMAHYPSCGVGGHCIPVDPYYLIKYGEQNGFTHTFLKEARNINNSMPHYTVDLLENALAERGLLLRESRIVVLGLAYKKDITDMRESPALTILEDLKEAGAHTVTYDPYIPEHSTARSLFEALHGSVGVIIATDHSEFCSLIPQDFREHGIAVVIDGKNCLPKQAFTTSDITYRGIGR